MGLEALTADVCSGSMFSRVLPKSLPQSVVAPWRAVLTVWANIPRLSVDPFVLDSRSFAPFRFRHDLARRPSMPRAGRCFSNAVAHGSVIPWQHINLLGKYDFSDEKLRDSVGIRPPN